MSDDFIPPSEKIITQQQPLLSGDRCANCKFFLADPSGNGPAVCRRFPPVPFLIKVHRNDEQQIIGNEQMSLMPITNEANWCGEWEQRAKGH